MDGYIRRLDLKVAAIDVAPGTTIDQADQWKTLFVWDDLPPGPVILEVELAAKLPSPRPSDIQTRWLRPGNDPTKREAHPVGSIESWARIICGVEFINETGDLPLAFQMWQKGSTKLTVVKIIPKAFTPAVYIADRIA